MRNGKGAQKIQELIYELKVGAVMTREVFTVKPATKFSDLRGVLRDNRISGAPVVENDNLVGIVSVEDFIKWLSEGGKDCSVEERMTRNVLTLFEDEPLVHAVSSLEEKGYGRLPVLNRSTGRLVGVITKGDIIEGVLRELEIGYHEEEIHHYRASHFFEDIIADKTTLIFQYSISGKSIEDGGEVASGLKKTLRRLDIPPGVVRKAAISAYEAEMNIIIYASEGEITVTVRPEKILFEVEDSGPGIADIDKALKPGFSTAPDWVRELGFGAGMGLNNIMSCAGSFHISSNVGQGTHLTFDISMDGA